jgi:hypothetical protein
MIVAGYEREINGCFLAANEGLNRRFPYKYLLPRYTPYDLLKIFVTSVNKRMGKEMFTKSLVTYLYQLIEALDENNVFANQAGDILNLVGEFFMEIFGNMTYNWGENKKTDLILINRTFASFLRSKNLKAVFF